MTHSFELLHKDKLFDRLEIEHYRCEKNGLEVILSPHDESSVIAMQLWYRVGSANEDEKATGLAHFFEHMMFRGTETNGLGEFDRQMEELGTPWGTNAFTWKDYTAYVVDIPSSGLDKALELEADRMQNLDLRDQNIHEERGAVLDEKHRSLNEFSSQRFDAFFEKAFAGQSSAWPVLGYEEHIRDYHPTLLEDYYKKHYSPNNALLVLCGQFEGLDPLALIDKHFAGIPASETSAKAVTRKLLPGSLQIKQAISLTRFEISYALNAQEEEAWVWDFIGHMMSGNEASLFENEFIVPGKALSTSFWFCESPKKQPSHSFLNLNFSLMKGVKVDDIQKRLTELFDNCEAWCVPDLLKSTLVTCKCQYYSMLSKLDDRASYFAEVWIYENNKIDCLRKHEEFYDSVDCEFLINKIKKLNTCPIFVMETQPE